MQIKLWKITKTDGNDILFLAETAENALRLYREHVKSINLDALGVGAAVTEADERDLTNEVGIALRLRFVARDWEMDN